MTLYFYQATDRTGKMIEGDLEAGDHRAAIQKIRSLNYFPVQVSEQKIKRGFSLDFQMPDFKLFPPINQKDLMTLTLQLATLVNSGITLDKSLATLAQLSEKPKTRTILVNIQKKVHSGSTFSAALAEYPNVFSKLYINMVRSGEASGLLGTVLARLADFMEKAEEFKGSVVSAMIYPIILVLVSLSAIIVLVTFVIPQLAPILGDMGDGLPLLTQMVLAFSAAFTEYWWVILLGFMLVVIGINIYLRTETGRMQWDTLALKLPVIGPLIQRVEVSRFSRTMSTLGQSGVAVLQSLNITRSLIGNHVMLKGMETLQKGLKSGKGISEPLRRLNLFPSLAVHMITVGEETGALNEMLAKVSDVYDKEVDRAMKRLLSLLPPVMIIVMAIFIGFLVAGMMLGVASLSTLPI